MLNAKTYRDMTPAEAGNALGTCEMGLIMLERAGSLRSLLGQLAEGEYSDALMADIVSQFWQSVRRRVIRLGEGVPMESALVAAPALTSWQWAALAGDAAGDTWSTAAHARALRGLHERVNAIHEQRAEGRLRTLALHLDDAIAFIDLEVSEAAVLAGGPDHG